MYKSSWKQVCPNLVEFVGAVAVVGVGEELKILLLSGGIDDVCQAQLQLSISLEIGLS